MPGSLESLRALPIGLGMLLQRLLDNLGLDVEPFATCGVAPGWRLRLPAGELVTLHFVLQGDGALGGQRAAPLALPTHSLAVVPPGLPHQLLVGVGALAEERTSPRGAPGLTHLRAGPDGDVSLLVACGRIRATWGGVRGLFDALDAPPGGGLLGYAAHAGGLRRVAGGTTVRSAGSCADGERVDAAVPGRVFPAHLRARRL